MRYLCNREGGSDLYPKEDDRARAKIEEFMDWDHVGLRQVTNKYVRLHYFDIVRKKPTPLDI